MDDEVEKEKVEKKKKIKNKFDSDSDESEEESNDEEINGAIAKSDENKENLSDSKKSIRLRF